MSRRVTGKDDILIDGFKVPPGTNVIMLNYHLHRDSTQFQDPNQFNPDRFENSRKYERMFLQYMGIMYMTIG